MLELKLIGEIAVRRDAQELALPASAKTRALLAYLAATGCEHRRETLCSLLWNVPDDPKGALRWSLSKLRHAVDAPDAPCLIANRETVRLDLAQARCDFAVLAAAAELHSLAALEEAAAIRGEFAPGLVLRGCDEFDGWLLATREDVRQRQVQLWLRLVGLLADDPERALPFSRCIVEEDPLGEEGWIRLVELLIACGRAEEAAAQRALGNRTLAAAGIAGPPALARAERQAVARPGPLGRPVIRQRVEFCTAPDGTGLAYSWVGSGRPLVKAANWLNHLEFEWESPIWRHWIEELSRHRKLVRYDERGNGLSDWKVPELSFEAFVQDLEILEDMNAKVEPPKELLQQALLEVETLGKLFDLILAITRMQTQHAEIEMEKVSLSRTLQDAVELYDPLAKEHSLQVSSCIEEGLLIRGNAHLLLQSICNLMDNAIKYTPRGGRVSIAGLASDEEIIVRVCDTGPGVPSELHDLITQPFYRAPLVTSAKGYGLGLAFVTAVNGVHGGRINFENLNPGFRVDWRIPRVELGSGGG